MIIKKVHNKKVKILRFTMNTNEREKGKIYTKDYKRLQKITKDYNLQIYTKEYKNYYITIFQTFKII